MGNVPLDTIFSLNLVINVLKLLQFKLWQHARKEVNVELMKEADFFGDIVIVPYMDNYDLVVLKTVAICEYGVRFSSNSRVDPLPFLPNSFSGIHEVGSLQVRTVAAKYIMKCDDDTFVRLDAVMNEVKKAPSARGLYIGNINYYHKPLRHGKWAVTYEVRNLSLPSYLILRRFICFYDLIAPLHVAFHKLYGIFVSFQFIMLMLTSVIIV